ncbi:hypothetical protein K488DRAFT_72091 [Vararia minispora EC-137]|uniref:Uncharacterized protein n=1 Tax=Vararia minispora EC-137 TaxID=1314806 RepID=A0ACB8QG71_9AGAM|nr:hypothetical protein K488DRAFT_72091 [Vararia minispora EC-137]
MHHLKLLLSIHVNLYLLPSSTKARHMGARVVLAFQALASVPQALCDFLIFTARTSGSGFIEPQLRRHNQLHKEVKISGGNKNDKIDHLVAAIMAYRTYESATVPMDIVPSNFQVAGFFPDDEDDEDLELYSRT